MSAHPDEENLNRWLGKHKFEEDKARKEQFEEDKARKEGSKGPDGGKPEKVQTCDVSWEQLVRVKEYSYRENVLVWFQGKQRFALLARSVRQKSGNQIDDKKSS